MEKTQITFDQLPAVVFELKENIANLNALLRSQSTQSPPPSDCWFSIQELSDYLPGKPAQTTIYGYVQHREIPFSRQGRRLIFLKSEIDSWLKSRHVKTISELEVVVKERQKNNRSPRK